MNYKKQLFYVSVFALTFSSIATNAQSREKNYDNVKASDELLEIQTAFQAGKSFDLNPILLEYIYKNHNQFPTIQANAGIEQKMQSLLPVYSQLNFIMQSFVIKSADSVTIEQAMLMASIGYQSVKLLSVANEFMESLSKKDKSYSVRLNGHNQAVRGIQTFLTGYIISTFVENSNNSVDAILTLSIKEFGPDIIDQLPKDTRKQIVKTIKEGYSNRVNDRVQLEFQNFVELL